MLWVYMLISMYVCMYVCTGTAVCMQLSGLRFYDAADLNLLSRCWCLMFLFGHCVLQLVIFFKAGCQCLRPRDFMCVAAKWFNLIHIFLFSVIFSRIESSCWRSFFKANIKFGNQYRMLTIKYIECFKKYVCEGTDEMPHSCSKAFPWHRENRRGTNNNKTNSIWNPPINSDTASNHKQCLAI